MHRRIRGLREFEFMRTRQTDGLNVTIVISGWLDEREDIYRPFEALLDTGDQYALCFESEQLQSLGRFFREWLTQQAMSYATVEVLKQTIVAGLAAALAWPVTLMSMASIVDNRWSTLLNRSKQAGRLLADVLMHRLHGGRPVILIGYSLGARVIFFCLRELYRKKAAGLVHEAYLLGTPAPASPRIWEEMDQIVAGRLVNGYVNHDWMLGFLLRSWTSQTRIAGLGAIESPRVENVDFSDQIEVHWQYRERMPWFLSQLGLLVDEKAAAEARAPCEKQQAPD